MPRLLEFLTYASKIEKPAAVVTLENDKNEINEGKTDNKPTAYQSSEFRNRMEYTCSLVIPIISKCAYEHAFRFTIFAV